jgi:hypothetical protein
VDTFALVVYRSVRYTREAGRKFKLYALEVTDLNSFCVKLL